MTTGEKIKSLRLQKHFSQEELGKLIGVKKAAINKYETGLVVNLKREIILKLSEVLDTTPGYLLGWNNEKEESMDNNNISSILNENNEFGERLRQIRKEKGLTLEDLADIYNSKFNGGLNKGTLSKYENNKKEPMTSVVNNLATILNISIDDLLGKEQLTTNTEKKDSNLLPFELSNHETKVIIAYHNQPDMQLAIDKVLGVSNDKDNYLMPIAAHLDDELTEETSASLQRDIAKVLALKNKHKFPPKS